MLGTPSRGVHARASPVSRPVNGRRVSWQDEDRLAAAWNTPEQALRLAFDLMDATSSPEPPLPPLPAPVNVPYYAAVFLDAESCRDIKQR